MIIKVSHCSAGKIVVSGDNVGSTETQGEGEARQGPALGIQMIRGGNLNENLNSLITLVLTQAYMSAVNKTSNTGPDTSV